MPKTIAPLPSGWATPHAPFPLDGRRAYDEVVFGAHSVSDGKWVAFQTSGQGVQCHLCGGPFRLWSRSEHLRVDGPTEVPASHRYRDALRIHLHTMGAIKRTLSFRKDKSGRVQRPQPAVVQPVNATEGAATDD
ncbi:hypothetical protein Tamer19_48160 [Cupriavidus sp. TA19]|nr:hypothetical protein Tamer19_48160 [Cupriavidus sp. TA19]